MSTETVTDNNLPVYLQKYGRQINIIEDTTTTFTRV